MKCDIDPDLVEKILYTCHDEWKVEPCIVIYKYYVQIECLNLYGQACVDLNRK